MATRVTLTSISSGFNGVDIDGNFDTIADEFDKCLYRDGTSPNQMTAALDMNSNEITHLAAPSNDSSAARLKDVQDLASVDGTTKEATNVTITDSGGHYSSDNVEGALQEFQDTPPFDSRYLQISNDLSDVSDAGTALTNLGIAKTGSDSNIVSGTAGSNTEIGLWNSDGDLVNASVVIDSDGNISGHGVELGSETANFTLAADDGGKILEVDKGTDVTVTVPPNSSVSLPVGFTVEFVQVGAGQVVLSEGSGVTVNNPGSALKSRTQWSLIGLYKRATDAWVLFGDIE